MSSPGDKHGTKRPASSSDVSQMFGFRCKSAERSRGMYEKRVSFPLACQLMSKSSLEQRNECTMLVKQLALKGSNNMRFCQAILLNENDVCLCLHLQDESTQWASADLGSDERKQKFLRLMGASKVAPLRKLTCYTFLPTISRKWVPDKVARFGDISKTQTFNVDRI